MTGKVQRGGRQQAAPLTPDQVKRAAAKAKRERIENKLAGDLIALGCPEPDREYQFAKAIGRRWRFDFAWPAHMLAVECDGGTWSGGRHVRGSGYAKDTEKLNQAAILGWRVLRYTSDVVQSGAAAKEVAMVLGAE